MATGNTVTTAPAISGSAGDPGEDARIGAGVVGRPGGMGQFGAPWNRLAEGGSTAWLEPQASPSDACVLAGITGVTAVRTWVEDRSLVLLPMGADGASPGVGPT